MDGFVGRIVVVRAMAVDRDGVCVKRKDADVPEHREDRNDDRDGAHETSPPRSAWHLRKAYGWSDVMSISGGSNFRQSFRAVPVIDRAGAGCPDSADGCGEEA